MINSHQCNTIALNCPVECSIPNELFEKIFIYVDASTLYKLIRVCRLFRLLAQPRLKAYAQRVTVRLWIYQSNWIAHKPFDFEWTAYNALRGTVMFSPMREPVSLKFNSCLPPPQIDGCTMLVRDCQSCSIYSISYNDKVTVTLAGQGVRTAGYSPSAKNDYSWQLVYDIDPISGADSIQRIRPQSLECDLNLLDPCFLAKMDAARCLCASTTALSNRI
ncbi:uncharacterized protein BYT42DRAFT_577515 [Radiomyces spectabilis]|uniref:uncharacterized protein n=1 Tax=Radiomyces spectabilis TaxID=64574 RepID=UPI00221EFE1B|nr:uncharacterized protein BYT42DRAFT_577515 [Radiomyces spectabilis]KAI8374747.1 hypothetical protein BYT42DRAFT_577515 [Radiomyces spectabilis]